MRQKFSISVGVIALLAPSSALAVPDVCDGTGLLEGEIPASTADGTLGGAKQTDQFGRSVAHGDFNGDGFQDLAVGVPYKNSNGADAGTVFVYYGPVAGGGTLVVGDADQKLIGPGFQEFMGWSMDVGNFDGDAKDDLLIGTVAQRGLSAGAGAAYMVSGETMNPTGSGTPAAIVDVGLQAMASFLGEYQGDQFGWELGNIGDANGDGIDDVLIGAPNHGTPGPVDYRPGAAYLFSSPFSGNLLAGVDNSARFLGDRHLSDFGATIENVGTLDSGDSVDDFLVGAPLDDTADINAGSVMVFLGSAFWSGDVNPSAAHLRFYGGTSDKLGKSGAPAGDVDGDGLSDFWVGASAAGRTANGTAFLIRGTDVSADESLVGNATTAITGYSNDRLGSSIATGDMNNDGVLDVVLGAPRASGVVAYSGAVYVAHGPFQAGDEGTVADASAVLQGEEGNGYFGQTMTVFDWGGDGFDDVLVGAPRVDNLESDSGAVFNFEGGADINDLTPYYTDTDGDGWGDSGTETYACIDPDGAGTLWVARGGDCNDDAGANGAAFYPTAPEDCSTGEDRNCDTIIGNSDNDADGFFACSADPALVDCDDTDFDRNPGLDELCNDGIDNDCDGLVDDSSAVDASPFYPDVDGDGFGDTLSGIISCVEPVFGAAIVSTGGDCDDADADINPGAAELCDGEDNDCDGTTDIDALDGLPWWPDNDGDGFGATNGVVLACARPTDYRGNRLDCDDTDADIKPGATEVCDFVDNDCDGNNYIGGIMDGGDAFARQLGANPQDEMGARAVEFLIDQDFDNDDELVIGNWRVDDNTGEVLIFRGGSAGGDKDAQSVFNGGYADFDIRLYATRRGSRFGYNVASGDFNGDGVGDLLVGAPGARAPNYEQGAVYLYYGPLADGEFAAEDADAVFRGPAEFSNLGAAMATGDIDNDGYDDFIVSAPRATNDYPEDGTVYVVFGSATNFSGGSFASVVAGAIIEGAGDRNYENMGEFITLMDLDGDNLDDIVLGSPKFGPLSRGAVYIVYGAPQFALSGNIPADATIEGVSGGSAIGKRVANLGDINGDGFDDLTLQRGLREMEVIFGGASRFAGVNTLPSVTDLQFTVPLRMTRLVGVGNLDNDAFDDFIFSDSEHSSLVGVGGEVYGENGAAYVVYGRGDWTKFGGSGRYNITQVESFGRVEFPDTFPTYSATNLGVLEGARLDGENEQDTFGSWVAGRGDFDGDGFDDILVGASGYDRTPLQQDAGRTYVYLGGSYGVDVFVDDTYKSLYHWDSDADGYTVDPASLGNPADATFLACALHVPISFADPNNPVPRAYLDPTGDLDGDGLPDLDCNDDDATVNPGATEGLGDSVDQDCDGYFDPNQLPVFTVRLLPEPATTESTLIAQIENFFDPDAGGPGETPITFQYTWFVNDVEVFNTSPDPARLSPSFFESGDTIRVSVVADDTRDLTPPVEDIVSIGNTPPVLADCEVTPATGGVISDWTAVASGLTDADPADAGVLTVQYQWQKFFPPDAWLDIPAANAQVRESCLETNVPSGSGGAETYNCGDSDRLRVICTPCDDTECGDDYISDEVVVANTAPTITSCQIIDGAGAVTTDDLNALMNHSDPDPEDTVTYTYTWIINGADSGITGSTLSNLETSHFDNIQVRCDAVDGRGAAAAPVTSAPITIGNTLPTAPDIELRPDNPRSNQDLFVEVLTDATDVDGDPLVYEYTWQENGAVVTNNQNDILDESNAQRGETWTVTVRAFDGFGLGPGDADSETIRNTQPVFTSAALTPVAPESSQNLIATASGFSDHDGDSNQSKYDWYINDILVAAPAPPNVMPSSRTQRLDTVYVEITAYDGFEDGNTLVSPTRTVQNSSPTDPQLAIGPNPPNENSTLTCTMTAASTDADGDPITYTVQWWQVGVPAPVAESSGVAANDPNAWILASTAQPGGQYTVGEEWYCRVRATDGQPVDQYSNWVSSPTIAIQDENAPAAPAITSIDPYQNSDVVTLTGDCVDNPIECDSIEFTCEDASGVQTTWFGTCSGTSFTETYTAPRGDLVECWAFCEDSSGNRSLRSNVVFTEVCDPYDTYELAGAAYGDSDAAPIDEWTTLADNDSATITATGNIINDDVEDWYLFRSSDNLTADLGNQVDRYHFEIDMVAGASDYRLTVFRGGTSNTQECPGVGTYNDYNFANYDNGPFSDRGTPADRQSCSGSGGNAQFKACENFTSSYWVKVTRPIGNDCQHYTLEVTNGSTFNPNSP